MARKKQRNPVEWMNPSALVTPTKFSLESDRGCVLVVAALVDEQIEQLLKIYFRNAQAPENREETINLLLNTGPMPPLGSFGVRISLCDALGLFTVLTIDRLKGLQRLRNVFAHFGEPVELTNKDVAAIADVEAWGEPMRQYHKLIEQDIAIQVATLGLFIMPPPARIQFAVAGAMLLLTVIKTQLRILTHPDGKSLERINPDDPLGPALEQMLKTTQTLEFGRLLEELAKETPPP